MHNESSKKGGANGNRADEEENKDEDKDEHDEEKLRKAREWDEWKDSMDYIKNYITLKMFFFFQAFTFIKNEIMRSFIFR